MNTKLKSAGGYRSCSIRHVLEVLSKKALEAELDQHLGIQPLRFSKQSHFKYKKWTENLKTVSDSTRRNNHPSLHEIEKVHLSLKSFLSVKTKCLLELRIKIFSALCERLINTRYF